MTGDRRVGGVLRRGALVPRGLLTALIVVLAGTSLYVPALTPISFIGSMLLTGLTVAGLAHRGPDPVAPALALGIATPIVVVIIGGIVADRLGIPVDADMWVVVAAVGAVGAVLLSVLPGVRASRAVDDAAPGEAVDPGRGGARRGDGRHATVRPLLGGALAVVVILVAAGAASLYTARLTDGAPFVELGALRPATGDEVIVEVGNQMGEHRDFLLLTTVDGEEREPVTVSLEAGEHGDLTIAARRDVTVSISLADPENPAVHIRSVFLVPWGGVR